MSVQPGDTLSLHFALRVRGGNEIDSSFDDAPITLTVGDGTLIPSLEQWLIGLSPGERHVFLLDAAQAFGAYDPALIQTLPLGDFSTEVLPALDSVLEFSLPNGTTLAGRIVFLTDTHAHVDFNHLLAGLPIEFEVEVVSID
jgi:FKBP-type peptidyl-prolyl cis-trans isomerase SlpA